MRLLPMCIMLGSLLIIACSDERGFSITGGGDRPLSDCQGIVFWVDGVSLGSRGIPQEDTSKRLLSVLVVTPGAAGAGVKIGSGRSESEGSTHRFENTVGAGGGQVGVVLDWDKVADVIEIEGSKWNRKDGTFFVVVKSLGKDAEVWQFKPRKGNATETEMIEQAKDELPEVDAIQQLKGTRTWL